jgi:hypothetical protein
MPDDPSRVQDQFGVGGSEQCGYKKLQEKIAPMSGLVQTWRRGRGPEEGRGRRVRAPGLLGRGL